MPDVKWPLPKEPTSEFPPLEYFENIVDYTLHPEPKEGRVVSHAAKDTAAS